MFRKFGKRIEESDVRTVELYGMAEESDRRAEEFNVR